MTLSPSEDDQRVGIANAQATEILLRIDDKHRNTRAFVLGQTVFAKDDPPVGGNRCIAQPRSGFRRYAQGRVHGGQYARLTGRLN